MQAKDKSPQFFVHYSGWNRRSVSTCILVTVHCYRCSHPLDPNPSSLSRCLGPSSPSTPPAGTNGCLRAEFSSGTRQICRSRKNCRHSIPSASIVATYHNYHSVPSKHPSHQSPTPGDSKCPQVLTRFNLVQMYVILGSVCIHLMGHSQWSCTRCSDLLICSSSIPFSKKRPKKRERPRRGGTIDLVGFV